MEFNHIANAFNGIEKEWMWKENINLTALAKFTYLDCKVSIICHKTRRRHLSVEVGAY